MKKSLSLLAICLAFVQAKAEPKADAIRVLFLGHECEHHNSNKF